MTQYLLSVYVTESDATRSRPRRSSRSTPTSTASTPRCRSSGAWVFAGGLHAPTTATVVDATGADVTVTDGPYAETKEQIGGFWVIEAADLDAALEWAKKASAACAGAVEVRPFQDESAE